MKKIASLFFILTSLTAIIYLAYDFILHGNKSALSSPSFRKNRMIETCINTMNIDLNQILNVTPLVQKTLSSSNQAPLIDYLQSYSIDYDKKKFALSPPPKTYFPLTSFYTFYAHSNEIFINVLAKMFSHGICPNFCQVNETIDSCFQKSILKGKEISPYTSTILVEALGLNLNIQFENFKIQKRNKKIEFIEKTVEIFNKQADLIQHISPLASPLKIMRLKAPKIVNQFLQQNGIRFFKGDQMIYMNLEELSIAEEFKLAVNFIRDHNIYYNFLKKSKATSYEIISQLESDPIKTNEDIIDLMQRRRMEFVKLIEEQKNKKNGEKVNPFLLAIFIKEFEEFIHLLKSIETVSSDLASFKQYLMNELDKYPLYLKKTPKHLQLLEKVEAASQIFAAAIDIKKSKLVPKFLWDEYEEEKNHD